MLHYFEHAAFETAVGKCSGYEANLPNIHSEVRCRTQMREAMSLLKAQVDISTAVDS